jgi:hypothetical protein
MCQSINLNRFDLKLLLKFVNSLPNAPEQTDNENLYAVAQLQECAAKLGEDPRYEFVSAWAFVMHNWPNLPPNSRLIEIDPKYADCIVRRFQEYSGKIGVLDGDGRTFEAIAGERRGEVARYVDRGDSASTTLA